MDQCPDGSYLPVPTSQSRVCLPCSSACFRCFGVADNCTDCVTSGHVLVTNGNGVTSCEPGCPIGHYAGVDKRCAPCDDSRCAGCAVGGQYCSACIEQSDLLEMGRCVRSCSVGLYPNRYRTCLPFCPDGEYSDFSGLCRPCSAPCQHCLSFDLCVTCQPGHYLLTNQRSCVSSCGRGLVPYSSSPSNGADMRLVGGLVSLDGYVQLYTRGKLACCSINVLLVIF